MHRSLASAHKSNLLLLLWCESVIKEASTMRNSLPPQVCCSYVNSWELLNFIERPNLSKRKLLIYMRQKWYCTTYFFVFWCLSTCTVAVCLPQDAGTYPLYLFPTFLSVETQEIPSLLDDWLAPTFSSSTHISRSWCSSDDDDEGVGCSLPCDSTCTHNTTDRGSPVSPPWWCLLLLCNSYVLRHLVFCCLLMFL